MVILVPAYVNERILQRTRWDLSNGPRPTALREALKALTVSGALLQKSCIFRIVFEPSRMLLFHVRTQLVFREERFLALRCGTGEPSVIRKCI